MKRFILFVILLVLAIFLDSLYPPCNYDLAFLPILIGSALVAGATGVGNMVSGFLNKKAVEDTNATNISLQNEANQLNKQMFDEQMDYNKYMYEDQKAYNNQLISQMNDYNSAASQRKRLEQAGFNPYLAYGGVDAGQMQNAIGVSPASAPSAPNMQAAHLQAPNYDFLGQGMRDIASIMNGYFQNANVAQDTIAKSIDNITRLDENIARLEGLRANNELTQARRQEVDEQITNLREMRTLQIEQMKAQTENIRSDSKNRRLDAEQKRIEIRIAKLQERYQEWFNEWSRNKGDKEILQLQSIISNIKASTSYTTAQELSERSKKVGIDLTNDQIKQLTPILVQGKHLENEQTELENKYGSNMWSAGGRWYERITRNGRKNIEKVSGYNRTTRWD